MLLRRQPGIRSDLRQHREMLKQTFCHDRGFLNIALVENGVEQLIELLGLHSKKDGLFVNHAFAEKIHCYAHHGSPRTLAVAGPEHPSLPS